MPDIEVEIRNKEEFARTILEKDFVNGMLNAMKQYATLFALRKANIKQVDFIVEITDMGFGDPEGLIIED